jgi:hypothetical protein
MHDKIDDSIVKRPTSCCSSMPVTTTICVVALYDYALAGV